MARVSWNYPLSEGPTTDTGPELIEGAPTLTGSLSTWDGSIMHLEGLNPTGTFQGAEVVQGTDYHVTFDYNTTAANTYVRLGGGGNVALISGPAVGTYNETLTAGGTGYIMQLLADGTGDFTNFSVKSAAGGDIIHNIDSSTQGNYLNQPLWDTVANFGDSNRYGVLEQDIVIPAGNDWEISFDWIRQDATGTGTSVPISGSLDYYISISDTGSATPNRLRIKDGGANGDFLNAYQNIALGQHCRTRIEKVGLTAELFIDDVSIGSVAASAGMVTSQLMRLDGANQFGVGAALQNIVIKDLTQGLTWDYGLDEGSGTDIINSDPSTPGYNGSWTPDTDWQPTGSYTNNGAWTPDTDWVFIPDNSRFYPMSGGSAGGATLICRDGNNQLTPANDATIQNYTDNWDRPS